MLFVCFPGVTSPCGCIFHSPVAGFNLLVFEVSWSHTTSRHNRYDFSGRVISPSQRPVPDNTKQSQHTNFHASGGIRTHDLSRRAAENLRLRPHGHWDWHFYACAGWWFMKDRTYATFCIMKDIACYWRSILVYVARYLPAFDCLLQTTEKPKQISSCLASGLQNTDRIPF